MAMIDSERLLAAIADAVVVADPDGLIVFWNPAAERLFGYPAAEALGRTLDLITPERLRSRHHAGFAHSMKTGTTRYGEQLLKVPALHRDGSNLSIAFTVAMLFDNAGKATGVAAVIRNETERFRSERELMKRLAALEQPQQPPAH